MKKLESKPLTVRVPPYTYNQLELLSEKKNLKKSAIIILALEEYSKKEREEGQKK